MSKSRRYRVEPIVVEVHELQGALDAPKGVLVDLCYAVVAKIEPPRTQRPKLPHAQPLQVVVVQVEVVYGKAGGKGRGGHRRDEVLPQVELVELLRPVLKRLRGDILDVVASADDKKNYEMSLIFIDSYNSATFCVLLLAYFCTSSIH